MSDKKIHSLKECVQIMSKGFILSNEEQIQLLPSGKTTVIHHRTGWAKWHLEKIGMIKTVSRGNYRITEDGEYSDASACGNEVASDHPMVRKFIIDSSFFRFSIIFQNIIYFTFQIIITNCISISSAFLSPAISP